MAPEVSNKTYVKITEEQLKEGDIWSFGMYSNIFFFWQFQLFYVFWHNLHYLIYLLYMSSHVEDLVINI